MSSSHRYDILDHPSQTFAQISILELLKTSSVHKEILKQALLESRVPDNINATQFQALIGSLISQHHLVFTSKDAHLMIHPTKSPSTLKSLSRSTKLKGSL